MQLLNKIISYGKMLCICCKQMLHNGRTGIVPLYRHGSCRQVELGCKPEIEKNVKIKFFTTDNFMSELKDRYKFYLFF